MLNIGLYQACMGRGFIYDRTGLNERTVAYELILFPALKIFLFFLGSFIGIPFLCSELLIFKI